MAAKDQESARGSSSSSALMPQWKCKQPSFFEMKQKDEFNDQQDWEYLSNPEGCELNIIQQMFVK